MARVVASLLGRARPRWRVTAEIDGADDAQARALEVSMHQIAGDAARVEHQERGLAVYVRDRRAAHHVAMRLRIRRELVGGRRGAIRVEECGRAGIWHVREGPPRAPVYIDESGQWVARLSPRQRRWCKAGAVLSAAVGFAWYGIWPGDLSYQFQGVLTLPLIVYVLYWLARHVPTRLHVPLALLVLPIGPVCYVIWSGARLWAWSGLSALPLVGIIVVRNFRERFRGGGRPRDPFTRNPPFSGPFGPP